jgi:hypothetical protein
LHRDSKYFAGIENISQGYRIFYSDKEYCTGIENIAQG